LPARRSLPQDNITTTVTTTTITITPEYLAGPGV